MQSRLQINCNNVAALPESTPEQFHRGASEDDELSLPQGYGGDLL